MFFFLEQRSTFNEMNCLKIHYRESSRLSASSHRSEAVKMLRAVGKMLNEDGVENTLGATNDSFFLFRMKNYFVSKAASLSLYRVVNLQFPNSFHTRPRVYLA